MRWALFAFLCLLAAAGVFVLVETGLLIRAARIDLGALATHADDVLTRTVTAEDTVIQASNQQIASFRNLDQRVNKTVADVHDLVIHTDMSLNGTTNHPETGLLPKLEEATDQIGAAAQSVGSVAPTANAAITAITASATDALGKSADMIDAATTDLDDPAIKASLAGVQETAKQTAQTATNVETATADFAAFVHRETAPVRGVWNTIRAFLKDFAEPLATGATAIK